MRTPTQIAIDVLIKLSEDEWGIPQMMAAGGGIGLGGGLLGTGLRQKGNINSLLKLHYQRPFLEKSKTDLNNLLASIRKEQPHLQNVRPRVLTKALLQNKGQISPEIYHTARKGYEEGLAGLYVAR